MVSAESLNFDVLQIIFSHLSVPDLASVLQVNRSFLAGALPGLYRSLGFYRNQAKRYPGVMTPFAVVTAHLDLAYHVQNIDIRVIPNVRVKLKAVPDPRFLSDCAAALRASDFLKSFTCTVGSALPPLLPCIQSKPRLHTLRIDAFLTTEQTALLCQLRELQSVTLENASSAVMDALPKWAEALKSTLEHLTIHKSTYLNNTVLQKTVEHLLKLRGLHVIECLRVSHVDVLTATERTPLLENLAITITDTHANLPRTSLTALKHLALDLAPFSLPSDSPGRTVPSSLLSSLLSLTRFTHLASLALRLPEREPFPEPVIEDIMDMHGAHLRSLRFMGCIVDISSLEVIMESAERLERLAISVPADDINTFSPVLSISSNLHTLIDVTEHGTHGPKSSLTTEPVQMLMDDVPSLVHVVSGSRLWTSRPGSWGPEARLERMKSSRGTGLWFTPPPEGR
ncbi:hypothetical protein BC834DRAFT_871545 [Gloeopeniophorella convolvens]|nr:hypothetical protein BC834DRAFT_871545 [Gloeopeniophorella convolvens]